MNSAKTNALNLLWLQLICIIRFWFYMMEVVEFINFV